jgi:hypothetical protein
MIFNRYRVGQKVKAYFIIWTNGRSGDYLSWHDGTITGTFIGHGRYLVELDNYVKIGQIDLMHYEIQAKYPDTEAARLLYE